VKLKVLTVLFAIVVGLHQGFRYYFASKAPYSTPSPDLNSIPFVKEHAMMSLRKPINALGGNVFRHLKKEVG